MNAPGALRVGDLEVVGPSDGTLSAPPECFGPDADFSGHGDPVDVDLVVCSHLHFDHCGWPIDRRRWA